MKNLYPVSAPSFISEVASGAPLVINSQSLVINLNADLLDGKHADEFRLKSEGIILGDLNSIPANTFLGNNTAAAGSVQALTAAQMQSALGYLTSYTETDPTVPSWAKTAAPSAIRFPRINANNTLTWLTNTDFRTAISAGTVTSVGLTVPVGFNASAAITTSGNIALTYATGYQGFTTAQSQKLNDIQTGATVGADWATNLTGIPANIVSWSALAPTAKANSAITITAGNGLNGGGNLTANRTITLGTPSAITLASTNSVGADTHSHAFAPGGTAAQYINGTGALVTFPTIPSLSGYATEAWVTTNHYNKTEVNNLIAGVYRIKGSVATYANLPTTGQIAGDVWNVIATGDNYVWVTDLDNTGVAGWDKLSGVVDLSGYVPTSRTITINGVTQNLTANRTFTTPDTITRLRGLATGTFVSGDISILAGANVSVSQTGTNITISSTDTNTTYSGSTSIILSGTSFQRAALTGDVTSPQNNNALTIANNAVTFAKMQNIPTGTVLGKLSAGTGNIETLTYAQLKTALNFGTAADSTVITSVTDTTAGRVLDNRGWMGHGLPIGLTGTDDLFALPLPTTNVNMFYYWNAGTAVPANCPFADGGNLTRYGAGSSFERLEVRRRGSTATFTANKNNGVWSAWAPVYNSLDLSANVNTMLGSANNAAILTNIGAASLTANNTFTGVNTFTGANTFTLSPTVRTLVTSADGALYDVNGSGGSGSGIFTGFAMHTNDGWTNRCFSAAGSIVTVRPGGSDARMFQLEVSSIGDAAIRALHSVSPRNWNILAYLNTDQTFTGFKSFTNGLTINRTILTSGYVFEVNGQSQFFSSIKVNGTVDAVNLLGNGSAITQLNPNNLAAFTTNVLSFAAQTPAGTSLSISGSINFRKLGELVFFRLVLNCTGSATVNQTRALNEVVPVGWRPIGNTMFMAARTSTTGSNRPTTIDISSSGTVTLFDIPVATDTLFVNGWFPIA